MSIEKPLPNMPNESIAYRAGREAAAAGVPIGRSALRNLHPDSQQYSDYIAGYDSNRPAAGRPTE